MNNSITKFHHIYNPINHKTFGSMTILTSIQYNDSHPTLPPFSILYSIAFCSPNDHFNKKIGRNIAIHRVNNNESQFTGITNPKTPKHNDIILSILCDLIAYNNYPDWAKKLILNNIITLSFNIINPKYKI